MSENSYAYIFNRLIKTAEANLGAINHGILMVLLTPWLVTTGLRIDILGMNLPYYAVPLAFFNATVVPQWLYRIMIATRFGSLIANGEKRLKANMSRMLEIEHRLGEAEARAKQLEEK